MRHYGVDSVRVIPTETSFYIIILNNETGQEISVHVPRLGVFSNPRRDLSESEAKQIGAEIAHMLGENFP